MVKKSDFSKGAYIYIEGDEDIDDIFIVENGTIQLTNYNRNVPRIKNTVKQGEVFGVISSLSNRPRMECAVAATDVTVDRVKRNEFIRLLQAQPDIALKILNTFSNQLRAYNELVVALLDGAKDVRTEEETLFRTGEFYFTESRYNHARHVLWKYLELYPDSIHSDEAHDMLDRIERSGERSIPEPIQQGPYRIYTDKQMVFCEDEPGDEMYIIKEGKVKIVKMSEDSEVMLSVLREGDIFGEMALISDMTRNASAICWGKTVLLPIRKETLPEVLKKSPSIIHVIFKALSQRIWFTFIRIEARLYEKPITQMYAFLENKLLENGVSLKSTDPVRLNFGINELFTMLGYSSARMGKTMDRLLEDGNLHFQFGETIIESPTQLTARAKYFKSRDQIETGDEVEGRPTKKVPEAATEEEPVPEEEFVPEKPEEEPVFDGEASGLDPEELRVPSQEIEF